MKRTTHSCLFALPLLVLGHTAFADMPVDAYEPSKTHLVTSLGLMDGGDKLATVEYRHGDDVDIRAGGLVLLGVGVNHEFGNNWELQATLNYLGAGANAKNGDVSFSRWPVEVLGFYRNGSHRFGGGLTYHVNPKFDVNLDNGPDDTINFDNALGVVVEYDYFFLRQLSLGVRGTLIDYKSSEVDGSINGNSIGVVVSGYFF
jgi:hypothetical protein